MEIARIVRQSASMDEMRARCIARVSEKCVRDELKSARSERNAKGSVQFHIPVLGESIRLHFCNQVTLKTETQQIGARLALHG